MEDTFTLPAASSNTLRAVLRTPPVLTPDDSLARFVQLARHYPTGQLPVQQAGRLVGMMGMEAAAESLSLPPGPVREAALRGPVSAKMAPMEAIIRPEMTLEEAGELCARVGASLLPVADQDNYLLGVVLASDLLLPEQYIPRPAVIGGMATPFGVYLTDGTIQAGVGNGALVAAGVQMGLLLVLTTLVVHGALWLAHRYAHLPYTPYLDPDFVATNKQPLFGLASILWQLVTTFLFLLIIRQTRLAGYHAAEHQVVHTVEREDSLHPDVVKRMPRAHPRCGTNLMAAGLVFFTLLQALMYIPYIDEMGISLLGAALVTLFTWRIVGTWLQERFTTRPANEKELASGIAAAQELLDKYAVSAPARRKLWQRLWSMGMLQTVIGGLLGFLPLWLFLQARGWLK